MINAPEQFNELNKSTIEGSLRFTQISLENAERLVKLQLDSAKTAFQENLKNTKTLLEAKDIQAFNVWRAQTTESAVENALAYFNNLFETAAQSRTEFTTAFEENLAAYNKGITSVFDKAIKTAPAGSEAAIAAIKSTLAATNAAVDNITQAGKQIANLADASVKAAATNAVNAIKTANKKVA